MSTTPIHAEPKNGAHAAPAVAHDLEDTARIGSGLGVAGKGIGIAIGAAEKSAGGKDYTVAVAGLRPSSAALEASGRTPGERRFNFTTYKLTAIATFVISAAALYWAKHSESKVWFGLGDSDKTMKVAWKETTDKIADWKFMKNETALNRFGIGAWKPFHFKDAANVADKFLETSATFVGGNVMLGIILPREKHKGDIVHRLNETHGTAEDVARGDARVAAEPRQSWGSIVSGRITAFLVVFASLTLTDKLIKAIGTNIVGKDALATALAGDEALKAAGQIPPRDAGNTAMNAAKKGLGAYVHWVGDKIQALGRRIAPQAAFTQQQGWDKIGQSVAVDAFATAAAVGILETTSRAVAAHRDRNRDKPADRPPVARESSNFTTKIGPASGAQPRAASHLAQAEHEKAERAQAETVRG